MVFCGVGRGACWGVVGCCHGRGLKGLVGSVGCCGFCGLLWVPWFFCGFCPRQRSPHHNLSEHIRTQSAWTPFPRSLWSPGLLGLSKKKEKPSKNSSQTPQYKRIIIPPIKLNYPSVFLSLWFWSIFDCSFSKKKFDFGIIFSIFAHYVCYLIRVLDCVCPIHETIIVVC